MSAGVEPRWVEHSLLEEGLEFTLSTSPRLAAKLNTPLIFRAISLSSLLPWKKETEGGSIQNCWNCGLGLRAQWV